MKDNKLIVIFGILMLAIVVLFALSTIVSAQSQQDTENELNNLIQELSNTGYDWLVNDKIFKCNMVYDN